MCNWAAQVSCDILAIVGSSDLSTLKELETGGGRLNRQTVWCTDCWGKEGRQCWKVNTDLSRCTIINKTPPIKCGYSHFLFKNYLKQDFFPKMLYNPKMFFKEFYELK
jgi:hypothetical protein